MTAVVNRILADHRVLAEPLTQTRVCTCGHGLPWRMWAEEHGRHLLEVAVMEGRMVAVQCITQEADRRALADDPKCMDYYSAAGVAKEGRVAR